MIWFTADTHFGHKRIPFYSKREFCLTAEEKRKIKTEEIGYSNSCASKDSINRMDDYLISNINKFVKQNDTLWHLGDFCFGPKESISQYAEKYRSRINCKNIFLIWGNHDDKSIGKFFTDCFEKIEIKHNSKIIVLNHYAQAIWHKSNYGSWMLYGHSHGNAEDWLDKSMPGRLSIDVGVDNIYKLIGEYRPISFEEISKLFKNRKGVSIDIS